MKIFLPRATIVAGALLVSQIFNAPVRAQDSLQPVVDNSAGPVATSAPAIATPSYGAPAANPAAKQPTLFRLSEGAASVIKLKRGNVNNDVIAAYVNSKRFTLSADDVVALHQEGVPDAVVTSMLQRSQGQPAAASLPVATSAPTVENALPAQTRAEPAQAAPPVTYVQAPTPVQTVVAAPAPVVVYQQPTYSYYDPYWTSPVYLGFGYGYRYPYYNHYYPYRYGYGYGYRPSVSVGFHGPHVGVGIGFGGGVHVGGGFHGGGSHGHHR